MRASSLSLPWSPAEARREIAADPERVFAVVSDPRTYPDWLLGAQEIRAVDADFPRVGSVFHHSVGPTEETTVDDVSEVLAVERPRRLVLRVHVGRMVGIAELLVDGTRDGSEVRFRERPAGLPRYAMPLLRPMLHGRNAKSLRQLEERVLTGDLGTVS